MPVYPGALRIADHSPRINFQEAWGGRTLIQNATAIRLQHVERENVPRLRVRRYTLSDEFHAFKTSHHMRTGACLSDSSTSLRVCLVGVRTDAAFDESIENLWSGR